MDAATLLSVIQRLSWIAEREETAEIRESVEEDPGMEG
jgi:hypothetical protein